MVGMVLGSQMDGSRVDGMRGLGVPAEVIFEVGCIRLNQISDKSAVHLDVQPPRVREEVIMVLRDYYNARCRLCNHLLAGGQSGPPTSVLAG